MLIPHLKEHADDGHHRKPSVGQLRRKFFGLLSWVAGGQDLEAEVARCGWGAGRLVLGNLAEGHVGCPHPAAGTLEIAARPLGTSANFNPADGLRYPGNLPVILAQLATRHSTKHTQVFDFKRSISLQCICTSKIMLRCAYSSKTSFTCLAYGCTMAALSVGGINRWLATQG